MTVFKNDREQELVNEVLIGMMFNRGGVIPNSTLSREDYLKDMLNTLNNQNAKYTELVKVTNKRTKKYITYLNNLADVHRNLATVNMLLAS